MDNTCGDSERKKRTRPTKYPRISKPLHLAQASYDCVVIGSGYGGGIAASRMARAGQSVCLLERGKERWPGEYPETLTQAAMDLNISGNRSRAFHKDKQIQFGNTSGMYHLIVGDGQSAVVGNGLGGTSLINANVFLEADAGTLSLDVWPPEIRDNPEALTEYYQKARDVFEPQSYPESWPKLKKVDLLKRQAKNLGLEQRYYNCPQTTRFREGPNSCGVGMSPSTLSGQDSTGLNDGSKTTTLVTYVADAWNWGADIFCQCEVRYIEEATDGRGGYNIYFIWHEPGRDKFHNGKRNDLLHVHAKNAVFLGAGSLGTTEILLRSKSMGLDISDDVGRGMSGNGDMLAFGYNCNEEVNAIGSAVQRACNPPVGPTINGIIDMREATDHPLHGFVIQDGAVPHALSRILQTIIDLQPRARGAKTSLIRRLKKKGAAWKSRLLGPYTKCGSIQKTQVFLIMSHDSGQGTMWLENDIPQLQFRAGGGAAREEAVHSLLREAIHGVGGTLISNPGLAMTGNHETTVHPLGGARMSRDNTALNGVTNHLGQVFTGRTASEIHSGLIVVDGAVVPAALGVNPMATISALAERAVDEYAKSQGLTISQDSNGTLDLFGLPTRARNVASGEPVASGQPDETLSSRRETANSIDRRPNKAAGGADVAAGHPLVSFTECMAGFVDDFAETASEREASFDIAYGAGRDKSQVAQFLLNAVVHGESRDGGEGRQETRVEGSLTGTFVCPAITGSPFTVQRGRLAIFQQDVSVSGTSKLVYNFDMTGINGRVLHFHGYKSVNSSVSGNPKKLWRALTTLYITLTDPNSPSRPVVAKGVLRMKLKDFGRELRSLKASGGSFLEKEANLGRFFLYFMSNSSSYLFLPLLRLQYPTPSKPNEFVNPTLPSRTVEIVASDGVKTILHVWEPQTPDAGSGSASARIENLFMIPGAGVDHQIYALPTVPVNAVNYFTRAGYRVFVSVHRIGMVEASQTGKWTTYDARLDIKACIEHIRENWSTKKLYTIAHCMGSVAFASGLLDGTIPSEWILGITCSQVFMNPIWSRSNSIKKSSPIPLDKVYRGVAGEWFDCRPSPTGSYVQRLIDEILRIYPEREGERCRSASCHRTTFLFGRCWSHDNLNEPTHRHIDKFFNGAGMTLMHLLMNMEGAVTNNAPDCEDLTTPSNISRLRGIPFFFFSGAESSVLSAASTEKTYDILTRTFGLSAGKPGGGLQYRRQVFRGYGHLDCWMGRNACDDIYPAVCEEVNRVIAEAE